MTERFDLRSVLRVLADATVETHSVNVHFAADGRRCSVPIYAVLRRTQTLEELHAHARELPDIIKRIEGLKSLYSAADQHAEKVAEGVEHRRRGQQNALSERVAAACEQIASALGRGAVPLQVGLEVVSRREDVGRCVVPPVRPDALTVSNERELGLPVDLAGDQDLERGCQALSLPDLAQRASELSAERSEVEVGSLPVEPAKPVGCASRVDPLCADEPDESDEPATDTLNDWVPR